MPGDAPYRSEREGVFDEYVDEPVATKVALPRPEEWQLIYELAQLPCLAASGWPHDGCFSCRAKALRNERERK